MRIAFVLDSVYPYNKGGKEKRAFEISTRLAARGHDVHVFCMKWWNGPERERLENGVWLHAISENHPLYTGGRRSIKQGLLFGLACLRLVAEDFDVLDVDSIPYFPLIAAKIVSVLKRRPMTATWHEVWGRDYWTAYLGWRGLVAYALQRLAARMANQTISVAALTTSRLRAELGARQPVHTIPIGVDFARIDAIEPADERIDVLYAGRLLAHKNVDMLVRAIGRLAKGRYPQIRCLIIGEGPEKKNLQSLARELGLEKQIDFVDFIATEDDLFARIKCAKVFVLPSTREGFGICVLEANACGIPVVVIDHQDNAARDLVRDGENGLVCRLEVESLAATLETILAGPDMRPGALAAARRYDWNNIIAQIEVALASSGRRQPRRAGQARLWTIGGSIGEGNVSHESAPVRSG